MKLREIEVEGLLQKQNCGFEMEGQEARGDRSELGQWDIKEIVQRRIRGTGREKAPGLLHPSAGHVMTISQSLRPAVHPSLQGTALPVECPSPPHTVLGGS